MIITILGDSTSCSIGDKKKIYPYKLFELLSKNNKVSINNYSSIGATSSDLNIYFHKNLKKKFFDYLIIYLGNNERVYTNQKKPYLNFFFWKIKNFLNFSSNNYSNLNFLEKSKFNFKNYLNSKKNLNSAKDFYKNLNSIIEVCTKKNIRVILINPVANFNFLPSYKINNFEYFKFIDRNEQISKLLSSSCEISKKLIKAIEESENNNLENSKKIYEDLIKTSKNENIKLIAKNNYAVILFREKKENLAKNIFYELVKQDKESKAIYYYNLSLVYKHNKDEVNYIKYKKLSYSSDFYSYRIKNECRNVITQFSQNKNIEVLDLKEVLNTGDFIDYCHPTNDGHTKIALKLFEIISKKKNLFFYKKKKSFKSFLFNPDYYNQPEKSFYDYYLIDKNICVKEVYNNIKKYELTGDCKNPFVKNFLEKVSKHPMIPITILTNRKFTPFSNELFSYPENFIHRVLYNIMDALEKNNMNILSTKYFFIKKKLFYKEIILKKDDIDDIIIENILDLIPNDLPKRILRFIEENQTIFSNQLSFREKTIMKWYTRESFRYGTASDFSMLFDRVNLDILIESILALKLKFNEKYDIINLFNSISQLLKIHENHINKYLANNENWSFNYEIQLRKIKKEIKVCLNHD